MEVSIFIDEKNEQKTVELAENSSVDDVLEKLGVNPVTVIVTRNDTLITGSEKLQDKDDLKILSVISGG